MKRTLGDYRREYHRPLLRRIMIPIRIYWGLMFRFITAGHSLFLFGYCIKKQHGEYTLKIKKTQSLSFKSIAGPVFKIQLDTTSIESVGDIYVRFTMSKIPLLLELKKTGEMALFHSDDFKKRLN